MSTCTKHKLIVDYYMLVLNINFFNSIRHMRDKSLVLPYYFECQSVWFLFIFLKGKYSFIRNERMIIKMRSLFIRDMMSKKTFASFRYFSIHYFLIVCRNVNCVLYCYCYNLTPLFKIKLGKILIWLYSFYFVEWI